MCVLNWAAFVRGFRSVLVWSAVQHPAVPVQEVPFLLEDRLKERGAIYQKVAHTLPYVIAVMTYV